MIPIVAYNYGAGHKKRIMDTIKLSTFIAVGIMLIGLIIFQVFPEGLLKLFNASDHMLEVGVPALRIISTSFLFSGYCIIVSVARQLLCILPLAYVFARVAGLHAVWYSFPLAELISVTLTTILFRRIYVKKLKNLKNDNN